MKKLLSALLTLVLLTSMIGFASAANDEKITLTYWNFTTGHDGELLKEIVDRFNATNDKNIFIEMDSMPANTYMEKLPPAIAANQAPDFVTCGSSQYPTFVENGSFVDMAAYFDRPNVDRSNFDDSIIEALTYNGVLIGIPFQVVTHYLFWDKDMFEAAGLDPEQPPRSFDEIKEFAAKLNNPARNEYGWLIPVNSNVVAQYTMYAFGGDYTDETETVATLNSPENVAAFEWMYDMYVNMKSSPADVNDNTYVSGQVGMFINGPWILPGLTENEINFGAIPVPSQPGYEKQARCVAVGFSIPKTTDPAKHNAIFDFIDFWTSTENQVDWSSRAGYPAFLATAREALKDDPIATAFAEPVGYSKVALKMAGVTNVAKESLYPAMEEIFAGADIQTTLDKYNAVAQSVLDAVNGK